jgi:predicted Zn-dependent protease
MHHDSQSRADWRRHARHCLIISVIVALTVNRIHAQPIAGSLAAHSRPSAGSSWGGASSGCDLVQASAPLKPLPKKMQQQRAEWALGSKLAADVEQRFDLFTDPFIVQYVNHLEHRIVSSSALLGCFVVKVLSDPEPHAYSLPGGFIYVSTGLIDLVENEGQLIAALAHETGHVTARHQTKIDAQARIWGRLALLGGPAGYGLKRLFGPILKSQILRSKESEADLLSLKYELASGYDPVELCRLLQLAFPEDGEKQPFFERIYGIHPGTNARVSRIRTPSRRVPKPQSGYALNTSEFVHMKIRFAVVMTARGDR